MSDITMLAGGSNKTVSQSPPLPSVFNLYFQFRKHLREGKKKTLIIVTDDIRSRDLSIHYL